MKQNKLELGNSQLPLSLQCGREIEVKKKENTDMVRHNNNDILQCTQLDHGSVAYALIL